MSKCSKNTPDVPVYFRDLAADERDLIVKYRIASEEKKKELLKFAKASAQKAKTKNNNIL